MKKKMLKISLDKKMMTIKLLTRRRKVIIKKIISLIRSLKRKSRSLLIL